MKELHIVCDRCKKGIRDSNVIALDYYGEEYDGLDICEGCDLQIRILSQCAKVDAIENVKPGTALKRWLDLYNQ